MICVFLGYHLNQARACRATESRERGAALTHTPHLNSSISHGSFSSSLVLPITYDPWLYLSSHSSPYDPDPMRRTDAQFLTTDTWFCLFLTIYVQLSSIKCATKWTMNLILLFSKPPAFSFNHTHCFWSSPLPLFQTQLKSPDVTVTSHKIYRYYGALWNTSHFYRCPIKAKLWNSNLFIKHNNKVCVWSDRIGIITDIVDRGSDFYQRFRLCALFYAAALPGPITF